ncbi:MAG: flagellar basal body-associated protein FliL [Lautropia sp.]
MSAKPDAKDEAGAPKKGKSKLMVIIVAAVLLLGGAGAGAWWFLRPKHAPEEEAVHAPKPAAERVFTTLEPFTVNLADDGGDRMAQVAVVVELESKAIEDRLTKNMPIVRNGVLMLISSLESKEILTVAGKERLAERIAIVAGNAIGWEDHGDDEEDPPEDDAEEPAKASKAKEGKDAKPPKKKRKKRVVRRAEPNPIVAVHFGQFIVQ